MLESRGVCLSAYLKGRMGNWGQVHSKAEEEEERVSFTFSPQTQINIKIELLLKLEIAELNLLVPHVMSADWAGCVTWSDAI